MNASRRAKSDWRQKHSDRLFSDDNLLGVGVGPKEVDQRATDTAAVKFYVRQKKEKLPRGKKLPSKVLNSPTDVVQMAPLRARGTFTQRLRPAVGGCSGSLFVPGPTFAGTLGLGLRGLGSLSDRTFIVSNNHVLANENRARIGDPVIQPSSGDGGDVQEDAIGELFDFVKLRFWGDLNSPPPVNRVDAACALVHRFGEFSREIFWVGYPKGWRSRESLERAVAAGNNRVQKTGRTTGYTQGQISAVAFDGEVEYESGIAFFEDQILIEPGNFSAGGDSGSAILDMDENIVGLLFAGGPTHTIANCIEDVVLFLPTIDFSDGVV